MMYFLSQQQQSHFPGIRMCQTGDLSSSLVDLQRKHSVVMGFLVKPNWLNIWIYSSSIRIYRAHLLQDGACLYFLRLVCKNRPSCLKWPPGWEIYLTTCTLVKKDHLLPLLPYINYCLILRVVTFIMAYFLLPVHLTPGPSRGVV